LPESFVLAVAADLHMPGPRPRGLKLIGKRGQSVLNWRSRRSRAHLEEVARDGLDDMLAQGPDSILLLGDLVNFGLPAEFEAAAELMADLGPPGQVAAIPGNHEAMTRNWEAPLRAAWAPWIAGDEGAGFPWIRRRGPIALIGLSSARATPPFFASGRIGSAQIARLRPLLRAAGAEGLIRVVAVHHPPLSLGSSRRSLTDARALRAALAEEGAELVLHGHLHAFSIHGVESPAGEIPVIGLPSLSLSPDEPGPGGWALLRFHPDGRATAEDRRRVAPGRVETRETHVLRLPGQGGQV
jgi:3',5'-cyclic AMP phosphodiesterase CpdA